MQCSQKDKVLIISFERSPFPPPVTDLLREMHRVGFFPHGLLIGSWPMLIYTLHFTLPYGLTTNDIDFAVDNAVRVPATGGETIPQVLERLGYDTCAVDLSRWGVRQAKQSVRGDFLVCDAQSELPFKDGIFDLVTCFDVLEHLQFPVNAIQHMLRICDGTLVCTTPNKTVEKPVRKIMGDYDESHISAKSASEWEKSIKDNADVKMLKVETFLDLTSKLLGERMFFKSFKLPSLGLTVRIVARK